MIKLKSFQVFINVLWIYIVVLTIISLYSMMSDVLWTFIKHKMQSILLFTFRLFLTYYFTFHDTILSMQRVLRITIHLYF